MKTIDSRAPAPVTRKTQDTGLTLAHLVAGLLVSLACVGVFAKVWDSVREQGGLSDAFDRTLLNYMHAHQSPLATTLASGLAVMGSPPVIVSIAVLGAVAGLFFRRIRGAAWTLPVAVIGAGVLIQGVKLSFHRPRPHLFTPLLTEGGFSFPSGHSLIAMVVYGLLGAFVMHLFTNKRARRMVAALTVLLIFAIGVSRIYVGVHYPTDVLAGWTAGVPWLGTCLFIHERLTRRYARAGEPVRDGPHGAG